MTKPDKSKKTLGIFSAASFLNDLGAEMLFPIWPLFVRNFLGLPLSFLGVVDGLGDALNAISQVFSGYFSDRFKKRKPFISAGYFLAFLGRLGVSFSAGPGSLIGFRSLDRLGKLRDAPRDAYLAEEYERKERGTSFGILRAFDNLGAVFGILASLALFPLLGFRPLIMLAALPTLFSVILVTGFIRERHNGRAVFHGVRFKDFSKPLKRLFASVAVFALGLFSYSFVLIGAEELGFSQRNVIVLYLVFTLSSVFAAVLAGRLSDKIGRKWTLGMSYIFWMIPLAGFIFLASGAAVWLLFVAYGFFKGSFETVSRVFAADLAPAELAGSILGSLQLVMGLLAFPASFLAGILWDAFGFRAPFAVSLLLSFISLIILLSVKEQR